MAQQQSVFLIVGEFLSVETADSVGNAIEEAGQPVLVYTSMLSNLERICLEQIAHEYNRARVYLTANTDTLTAGQNIEIIKNYQALAKTAVERMGY